MTGPFSAQVVVEDGRLRMKILNDDVALVPVGPMRFTIEGAPPGSFLDFHQEGDAIVSFELFQGGASMLTLPRAGD